MTARQLKRFRDSRNLTQQQLADRLGISRNLLNMYENQKRRIPKHIEIHLTDIKQIEKLTKMRSVMPLLRVRELCQKNQKDLFHLMNG